MLSISLLRTDTSEKLLTSEMTAEGRNVIDMRTGRFVCAALSLMLVNTGGDGERDRSFRGCSGNMKREPSNQVFFRPLCASPGGGGLALNKFIQHLRGFFGAVIILLGR